MSADRIAVVLAAGQGTRMNSSLVKVLHPVAGRPMVERVVRSATGAGCDVAVVVIGRQSDQVREALGPRPDVRFAVQQQQLGTGDAVRAAAAAVGDLEGTVLIVPGDVPLVRASTLRGLADAHEAAGASVTVLSMVLEDARWYGRIVRGDDGGVRGIVEARDCSAEQLALREVNTGVYAADAATLFAGDGLLAGLSPDNDQAELYLTDIVAAAAQRGLRVEALVHGDPDEVQGVNDRRELDLAEASLYARVARQWQIDGVTLRDPASIRIDPEVLLTRDVVLEPGVQLRGDTTVGEGAVIETGAILTDCTVGAGAVVGPGCVLHAADVGNRALLRPYTVMTGINEKQPAASEPADRVQVGQGCKIGPFAHLRMRSTLGADVHLGNFVEAKATRMDDGAKANHLAYLGDGVIGCRSNVGAGVIFCNYDGMDKHRTTIGEDAFVGSDSQMVAPVVVGDRAYVGSGSTVTKDVPDGALLVTRAQPRLIAGAGDRKHERIRERKAARARGGK